MKKGNEMKEMKGTNKLPKKLPARSNGEECETIRNQWL